MAKKGDSTGWDKLRKKVKSVKREMIIIHGATIILGMLMVAFPDKIVGLLCQVMGILLCVWGIFRVISYFMAKAEDVFGSFGLVQGGVMICIGVFFLVTPDFLGRFIDMTLAVVLLIAAVVKLQYAFDFLKAGSAKWWIHLIGVAVMAALGIMAMTKPFGVGNIVMILMGCGLIFSGVWDLVSVIYMSRNVKSAVRQAEKKVRQKEKLVDTVIDEETND